jgi:hypothetical protein
MNTILICTNVLLILLLLLAMNKLGKLSKQKQVVMYRNVNDSWILPDKRPTGKTHYIPVIVTVRNKNSHPRVCESIYNVSQKRFTGLTKDFHERVIAWMPYPEPCKK